MEHSGRVSRHEAGIDPQPSLFDLFYEEFLTQFMNGGDPNKISEEFLKLRSDIERVDFIMRIPFVRDFQIKNKAGIKSHEKSVKYREEGNKLFQSDRATQSILFYNKSISYSPHPTLHEIQEGLATDQDKVKEVQFAVDGEDKEKKRRAGATNSAPVFAGGKYEALALSYANRSAALRKLCQYEECLKDISRAAKFGYPRENLYKLWERKGKCYQGLKRYDLAAKCYRQALQSLKESTLSESQKSGKSAEIQQLLKELRTILLKVGGASGKDGEAAEGAQEQHPPTKGGADQQQANRKMSKDNSQCSVDADSSSGLSTMVASTSQMSISHISTSATIRPEVEIPELSYGPNPRLPSASAAIDLQFCPDKGRFFVATQDLMPGDVILREEPYAAVLETVFRVNHCANCLRKTSTPIPCFECATVQYCCETCRLESWTRFHKVECGILAYLEPSKCLGRLPHLALRIITKTGLQNLVKHSQRMLPAASGRDQAVDSLQFDPTSYRSVHNLATNTDKRSFEDLLKKSAEAVFMSKCLKFNGFYGDPGNMTVEAQRAEIFLSSLILRHLQVAATNGLEMAECILKNNDITKFDIIPIGGAIFPTMSFFNHSCYPNAMRLGYQNQQVVRVIRPVPLGAEVNIDYGFDFYATPLEVRQKRAAAGYHFRCECVACTHRWPVYERLLDLPAKFRRELTAEDRQDVARQAANYHAAMEHLVRLDVGRAIPLLADYITYMSEIVVHPDARYLDSEEAYKQCLWLENRGYKIIKPKK